MFEEMTYDEWSKLVKKKFAEAGLQLPEEEELLQLAYMECQANNWTVNEFVRQTAAAQQG